MSDVLSCTTHSWSPGIGDPTWTGWSTVLVYLSVMVLAAMLARRAPFPAYSLTRERLFWMVIALLLMALALNKELDLQSALTAIGRCAAKAQGWYEDRRQVQGAFLMLIAAGGLVALGILLWLLRGTWSRSALPVLGLCFLMAFVLMRAVGFHQFDQMLGIPMMGVRANVVLEWIGPLLIGATAVRLLVRQPPPSRQATGLSAASKDGLARLTRSDRAKS